MEEELPNEFDLIVVGTGFSESIVAAAASRIGKTVLHLDPNEFYGGVWASFNLESLQNFLNKTNTGSNDQEKTGNGGGDGSECDDNADKNSKIVENCCDVINAAQKWHIKETNPNLDTDTAASTTSDTTKITNTTENVETMNVSEKEQKQNEHHQQLSTELSSTNRTTNEEDNNWTKDKVMKNFRKFNIDLIPKVLYCNGKLVKLLIKSNICRYAEFRAIDKILTIYENEIKSVPCTRSDVFSSNSLRAVEKRLLMKLLTNCMNYNKNDDDDDKDNDDPYDYFNDKDNKKQIKNENDKKSTANDGNDDDNERKEAEGTEEEKQEIENINDDFAEYKNKKFLEYLKGQKLTDQIIHCVLYSISMCNKNTMFLDGIRQTKKFLNSLGRYGNTPFLFPMYGCGELPQDFCRLCAVFGGIYCLKRSIDSIKIENDHNNGDGDKNMKKIETILCNKQHIKVNNIIIGSNNIPNCLLEELNEKRMEMKQNHHDDDDDDEEYCGNITRGVFITTQPIGNAELNSGGGGVNIMKLPNNEDDDDDNAAFVIQLSHYSGTCPKGLYLIHIITKSKTNSPENDLKPYISQIFQLNENTNDDDNGKLIKILYSAYFTINKCKNCEYRKIMKSSTATTTSITSLNEKYSNLYLTCGPYYEIDYDKSIQNAYKIFKKLYPNDEFLPRAPDPEEIIIGDEDPLKIENDNEVNDDNKELQENQKNDTVTDAEKCATDSTKNEQKDENDEKN